jgi:DNA-directed RNA polymerase subunit RPC12/RpoP
MTVTNSIIHFTENDKVVCPKCNLDLSNEVKDPWIAHESCEEDELKAEEYVVCPKCGVEITLRTWIEEF